jgi:hypothetical protein
MAEECENCGAEKPSDQCILIATCDACGGVFVAINGLVVTPHACIGCAGTVVLSIPYVPAKLREADARIDDDFHKRMEERHPARVQ